MKVGELPIKSPQLLRHPFIFKNRSPWTWRSQGSAHYNLWICLSGTPEIEVDGRSYSAAPWTAFMLRHKPPVKPMDVAFLVPEASKMDETAVSRGSSTSVVLRVLMAQIGVGVVLAAVLWGFYGHVAGYSALLGALTCVLPNGFLALRLAVPRRDPGARALIQAAYIGELGKLGLTVLMFISVFLRLRPLVVAPLFAGFIAAQLMTFAGLLMRDKPGTERTNETVNGE